MTESVIYYKIQHKDRPNQFVRGTPTYYGYDSMGRIFQGLGPVRTFITNAIKAKRPVTDWQVVEIEMRVAGVKQMHEVIKPEKLIQLLKQ